MKKSISFLLILTMILSMLCIVPAVAAGDVKKSGDFSYRVKQDGTAVITDYDFPSKSSGELKITVPTLIDGYPVTEIGDIAFAYGPDGQEVRILLPDGITKIGNSAFRDLKLTALNIPDSVEEIGDGILTSSANTALNISMDHPHFALMNGLLYNKQQKKLIACTKSSLYTGNIPEGIVSIGNHVFYGTVIDNVAFPSSLKEIGTFAFEYCKFKGDTLFPNVQTLGRFAFSNCRPFSEADCSISFKSLEEIVEHAFDFEGYSYRKKDPLFGGYYDEYSYIGIDFGNSPITAIPDKVFAHDKYTAFWHEGFEIISINVKSIVSIGNGNNKLGSFFKSLSNFSPNLTSIPTGLNPSVNSLPNTVKRIESNAYVTGSSDHGKRTDFYLPSSLEYIAEDAFATGSTFIVEPDSYALRWCKDNGFGYKINGEKQNLDWLNN